MKQGYCSEKCQRKHWSAHKKECKKMGEEEEEEEEDLTPQEKKNPFDKEKEPKRWKFFEDNKSNRHEDLDAWTKNLCRRSDCLGTPCGRWEGAWFCSEQCQTDSGY
jgi:hypothetical protein